MQHGKGFEELVTAARAHVAETDVGTMVKRLAARARGEEKFHLVDVREDEEWKGGHLPGAIHVGRGVIERDIEQKIPGRDDEIVLYCGGGFRSVLAAESLAKMGYRKVVSMDGGFRGWKEAGQPLDR